jgi:hypothetical protein
MDCKHAEGIRAEVVLQVLPDLVVGLPQPFIVVRCSKCKAILNVFFEKKLPPVPYPPVSMG